MLMLVSAAVDTSLRNAVESGLRPRPEYLLLERDHGVELLDWSRLPGTQRGRSAWSSAVHAAAALRIAGRHEAVLSDGEHVGIPLSIGMHALGTVTPHLVIGHHLTTAAKKRMFRQFHAHRGMSRILVHSHLQAEMAQRDLGIPAEKLCHVAYYADTDFWRPSGSSEERLVVAAGREHRDYATLAEACGGIDADVLVAAGSVHSPAATSREPTAWPANFKRGFADYRALREMYSRAGVVVVPLVDTDFQAGITTLLEAMSMEKAVVVTTTRGLDQVVLDGVTGIQVAPGDAAQLRDAVSYLLDSPQTRRRLGAAARESVVALYSAEMFADRVAEHLAQLANRDRAAA